MDQAEKLRSLIQDKNEAPQRKSINSRVIAISSGKGGVGKTNFTLNLAIQFQKYNKKVVIFDSDFGLANIEVLFGKSPKYSFADVIKGRKSIKEVLTEGPEGVQFISGGSGILDRIKENDTNLSYIVDNFAVLDSMFDIILVDTGAGISKNVINFIIASNEAIIVTTPEPTSLTDAYALIKTIKHCGSSFIPSLNVVVNRVENIREGKEVYNKLRSVTYNFLNMDIGILGYIPNDTNLVKAVKMQQPISTSFPNSAFSKSMDKIAQIILDVDESDLGENSGANFVKRLVGMFNS